MPDLPSRVDELTEEVARLRVAVENFRPELNRAKRATFRTTTFVALVALLSLALVWGQVQQAATSERLERVVQGAFCPFYDLILGSYDPSTRGAGADRVKYETSFAAMRAQREVLGCSGQLVPPRVGS